jgi:hypothetical protein
MAHHVSIIAHHVSPMHQWLAVYDEFAESPSLPQTKIPNKKYGC